MSIDADMRNGVITAVQASKMRAALERETYFYGSLDGAMKFVKGDAVAGLVVALVNIVGGLTVGIAQRGMSFGDALHAYTILTVGDGLVSQIPSLIVSVAAGILVTRVASGEGADAHLGGDIYRQLATHPKAIALAGVACASLAVIPGFPHIQFAVAGALLLALAFTLMRNAALAMNSQRALMPEMTRDGGNYVPRILDDVELGTSATLRLRLGLKAFDALRPEALNKQLDGRAGLAVPRACAAARRAARSATLHHRSRRCSAGEQYAGRRTHPAKRDRACDYVRGCRGLSAGRGEIGVGAERECGGGQQSGDSQSEHRRGAV
jgi:type III secretion protein V